MLATAATKSALLGDPPPPPPPAVFPLPPPAAPAANSSCGGCWFSVRLRAAASVSFSCSRIWRAVTSDDSWVARALWAWALSQAALTCQGVE